MAKSKLDFLNAEADKLEGFEDVNSSTMAIPFIKLAQDLTPQVKKSKPEYIEGLEVGMFFNSVTGEIYGTHLEIIIVKFDRLYIEWLPNRGGFVGYHTPENAQRIADDDTFGKWKTKEGNELVEYYAYYIILVGHEMEGPMILSLTSTGIKVAKSLNRQITTHQMDNGVRAKPYYLVYNLDSALMTKGQNDFYSYKFVFKDYITEEQYKIVGEERLALPDKTVNYELLGDSHGKSDDEEDDDDL